MSECGLPRLRPPTGLHLALAALLLLPLAVHAEFSGRMEAGIGGFALTQPNYPGSDQYKVLALPLPYFLYQGDTLRVTSEGASAKLFATDRLRLNISFSANLNSEDQDPPRQDMPKLLPTFEAGPSLDVRLWRSDDAAIRLRLRVPVRAAAATNARDFAAIGFVFNPHLAVSHLAQWGSWQSKLWATAGPSFASQKNNAYFYSVQPQFVTATRPAYEASGGYSGSAVSLAWSMTRERWRFGVFGSYNSLEGAVFQSSPLVQTKQARIVGVFFNYRLYQNKPAYEISGADALE